MRKEKIARICALLFSVSVALTGIPATVFAEENVNVEKNVTLNGQEEQEFVVQAQIGTGAFRDMTLTGKTSFYQGQTWKEASVTFESNDASAETTNPLNLKPVLAETDVLFDAGTSYSTSKGVYGTLAKDTDGDGVYTGLSFTAKKNGPAKETKTFFITVTHEDSSVDYYKLSAVRKGYAGIAWNTYMCYTDPAKAYVLSSYDEETGRMYAGTNFVKTSAISGLYDEEGNDLLRSYPVEFEVQEKDKDVLTIENSNYYAKVPGIYQVDFYYDKTDETYSQYVVARYAKNVANNILAQAKTDGVIDVSKCSNEEEFAAVFPESYQEVAKQFFSDYNTLTEKLGGTWESGAAYEDSLKLYNLSQQASDIWENVYDIKAAKETIHSMVSSYPQVKQTELEKIADRYCGLIELEYTKKRINSVEDVQAMVQEAEEKMDEATTISMKDCTMTLSETSCVYDGKEKTPSVTVTDTEGNTVPEEKYTVTYRSNVEEGTAYVVVKANAKGYKGTQVVEFTIAREDYTTELSKTSYIYDGKEKKPEVIIKDSKGNIVEKDKYVLTYHNNTNVGTAYVEIKPMDASFKGNRILSFTIGKAPQKIIVKNTRYALAKSMSGTKLNASVNSKNRLVYSSSNEKAVIVNSAGKMYPVGKGSAVITISAEESAGYQAGTPVKIRVSVVDRPAVVKKIALKSKKSGQLSVSWKRDKKVNGYEIITASNSKFTANAKKAAMKKNTSTAVTFKGLGKNKKYYVKVRSYVNTANGKVYGAWSKTIALKVKK